jgi:hypothetical protein
MMGFRRSIADSSLKLSWPQAALIDDTDTKFWGGGVVVGVRTAIALPS